MKVRELYNQLDHDLQAHGELEFMVQIKQDDGSLLECVFVADRYVSMDEPSRYVLRMVPLHVWNPRS